MQPGIAAERQSVAHKLSMWGVEPHQPELSDAVAIAGVFELTGCGWKAECGCIHNILCAEEQQRPVNKLIVFAMHDARQQADGSASRCYEGQHRIPDIHLGCQSTVGLWPRTIQAAFLSNVKANGFQKVNFQAELPAVIFERCIFYTGFLCVHMPGDCGYTTALVPRHFDIARTVSKAHFTEALETTG